MGDNAVRLRRATLEDFDFCKRMMDDIYNEVLYCNYYAFLEIPGIAQKIQEEKKKDPVNIDFYLPEFTREWFEKEITEFKDKYYIIELVNPEDHEMKDIGFFKVSYMTRKEPNRINYWTMIPDYFELKGEALRLLLAQKELINKKITIVSIDEWLNDWLAQFGFIRENCFLRVMSKEST